MSIIYNSRLAQADSFLMSNGRILYPTQFSIPNPETFNDSVIIGNKITTCAGLFNNTVLFNKPVTIPNSVNSCASMFADAQSFNQPVIIPNSVNSCASMFIRTASFNQPITIPNSVNSCAYMFSYAQYMSSNIYFKGTGDINITSLLQNRLATTKINIFFNSARNAIFNVNNTLSIIGNSITWATMTNGFYNATYNIYCYYNYV